MPALHPSVSPLDPPAAGVSVCQLLEGGAGFFPALISALDLAVRRIQLETYIFDVYGAGGEVAQALARAAGRGVEVQVLVDGVGTGALGPGWAEQLQRAGVQWQVFSPVTGRWGRLGLLLTPQRWRRLHRKLCVIDGELLFCGGINVLDDYYDPHHGVLTTPRFDFTLLIRGPVARLAAQAMAVLWARVSAGYSVRHHHLGQAWDNLREAGQAARKMRRRRARWRRDGGSAPASSASQRAMLVLRDNLSHRDSIERAYRQAIGQARQEIWIANAYFLPGGRLRRALINAARRGVKVTLLLQGKYEYFMQYHAVRPVYGALLAAGVEIYEYETGFLHAKVAVVDGVWATVGSSNLDPLSLLLAREANVVVQDPAFAQSLRASLQAALATHGRRVQAHTIAQRPWRQRLLDQLAYGLMRLALLLAGQRY